MLLGGILSLALFLPRFAFAAPEIYSLDPETGPAGTPITLKGKGLATTHHVVFAVGRTVKRATFRVVSDRELQITAPEYYRPQAAATVAVFTRQGAVVAMPASGQKVWGPVAGRSAREQGATLYHVMPGGFVPDAESVAVIEAGGIVQTSTSAGMHFVKRGGVLRSYTNPNGVVFHEPGIRVSFENLRLPIQPTYITVPHVVVSQGVGPFIYQGPPRPANAGGLVRLPRIDAFAPRAAAAGDIVTLHGRGFSATRSVWFKEPGLAPTSTGFRIISDSELRVEVPDETVQSGPELIVVLTTEGVTVTVPRDRLLRAAALPRPPTNRFQPVMWVAPGDFTDVSGGDAVFVDNGGVVLRSSARPVFFVKRGGELPDRAAGNAEVFYEPRALVSANLKNARNSHEVPHIIPSYVHAPFAVLPGPMLRR
jgi:hypothetical protein